VAGVGSLNSIMTTSTDDFFGLSQGVSAICVLIYALMVVLMFIGVLMVVLMFFWCVNICVNVGINVCSFMKLVED